MSSLLSSASPCIDFFDLRRWGYQRPIRLYLVANAVAGEVLSPSDPRLHYIGSMALDRRGRGLLRFTVPDLVPDTYAVAGLCIQCARYSSGRTFFVLHVSEQDIAPRWRPLMLLRIEAS